MLNKNITDWTKEQKEAQIQIINIILNSLCIMDLNNTGRNFLKDLIRTLKLEINKKNS